MRRMKHHALRPEEPSIPLRKRDVRKVVARALFRVRERELNSMRERVDRKSEEFAGMLERLLESANEPA